MKLLTKTNLSRYAYIAGAGAFGTLFGQPQHGSGRSFAFTISQAKTLSEIEKAGETAILPIDEVFGIYRAVTVSTAQAQRFSNGGELMSDRLKTDIIASIYRVYSPEKEFLGLGEITAEDMSVLKVKKVVGK